MSVPFAAVSLDCHPACDQLTREYLSFFQRTQGVTNSTIRARRLVVGAFLQRGLKHSCTSAELDRLDPCAIHDYVIENAVGPRSARKQIVSGLRSFLKFLQINGYISKSLVDAVPIIHIPREERVPRGVPWADVERVLHAPDRATESGRRGYALVSLLAAYGLRIGQAMRLQLSDVHWSTGTICFAAQKGGKPLRLPLTADVADALLDYLKDRGPAEFPEFFLSLTKPRRQLGRDYIPSEQFDRYYRNAATHARGTHAIRHSFASRLVQNDIPIKTIADLLGHSSINTTFVYTKVHVEQLRQMSSEWPSDESHREAK
jgi:integrase